MKQRYVLLVTTLTAVGLLIPPSTMAGDIEEDGTYQLPNLHVDPQVSDGSTVTISRVNANESLWVVIHADQDGQFAEVLGNSELLDEGLHVGVDIEINLTAEDNETVALHAMLHFDDGDGEYEFPDADMPMSNDTGIINHRFNVSVQSDQVVVATGTAEWEQEQEDDDGDIVDLNGDDGIEIELARLARPGYVVLHLDEGGGPGQVVGNSEHLEAGEHSDVSVPLNRTMFSLNGTSTTLWAMIHFDDGDEQYLFPGPDAPVTVEGVPVMTPFPVVAEEEDRDEDEGEDEDVGVQPSPTEEEGEDTPAPGVAALLLALSGMLFVATRLRRRG